ncbi:helix-turn-helix transcriptional regulator [Chryseobacterium sp. MMS23-Vi53]|uniref:helix-turn-helix transcriptional regulator n=1 Tax=Chryseobacterium sp. MMS23-Vi53 TaxID=3386644 RepID=UPI0039E8E1BA
MVKDGDPFFLTKFKEVHPDFFENLIFNHPNLTELDIKFCAYLRLSLSNKEIMQYENVSLRTIETRRYRLKKKLGLSSEVDLTRWLMEL